MGCWCRNTEHNCFISRLLNSWVLRTSLMSQHSHSFHRHCPKWLLAHSHWIPTPTERLFILPGIQPAELRRLGAKLSLAYRGFLDPDHMLYGFLNGASDTRQERLRSRQCLRYLRGIYKATLLDLAFLEIMFQKKHWAEKVKGAKAKFTVPANERL